MQIQSISTKTIQQKDTFLRRALQANALFSLTTGTAFVVASGAVARFIGADIPSYIVLIVGLGLLPFGYMIYRLTAQANIPAKEAGTITVMDVSWVVGSVLLLVLGWSLFSVAGRWLIGLQAEAVATFALLQTIGLRRLQK
ncbi:MAG: hypothetical protein GY805_30655 [Chloroflexi bacterium]|nr:hypothetical protein [Chloroflexota bacterium]